MRRALILAGALGIVITAWACGGSSSSSPTSPTPNPPSTPPPSSVTVMITGSGVSTHTVDLAVGGTVTFMNNDTIEHDVESNPHPAHTDCPAINSVGKLQPGQSRATAALTVARSCGWHDHDQPGASSLQGTITIH